MEPEEKKLPKRVCDAFQKDLSPYSIKGDIKKTDLPHIRLPVPFLP